MAGDDRALNFGVRRDASGWTVYNIGTGMPADLNGVAQKGLSQAVAEAVADLLNAMVDALVQNAQLDTALKRLPGMQLLHEVVKSAITGRIGEDRFFEARPDAGGRSWTVFDLTTGEPATIAGVRQEKLSMGLARDAAAFLNQNLKNLH